MHRTSLCGLVALATLVAAAPAAAAPPRTAAPEGHVLGFAHVSAKAPVVGGRVTVRTPAGRDVTRGRPRTGSRGTFGVRVRRPARRLIVTVRGGRAAGRRWRGTLRAVVPPRRLVRITHVNLATTLAARRWARHRRAGLRRAEAAVRRHLRFPPSYDLGADLRVSAAAFDGHRLLRAARRRGGVDRYLARLARQMEAGRRGRSFGSAARARASISAGSVLNAILEGALDDLLDVSAAKWGGTGFGYVLSALGFGQGDGDTALADKIDALSAKLDRLSEQVTALEAEVAQLDADVTQSEYSSLVGQVAGLTAAASDIQTNLVYIASTARDCTTPLSQCLGAIPEDVDPLAWCTTSVPRRTHVQAAACAALRAIDRLNPDTVRSRFNLAMAGQNAADGILVAFQKARYAQIRAAGGFVDRRYFMDAANVFQSFAAQQITLGQLVAEYQNAEGFDPALVQAGADELAQDLNEDQAPLLADPLPQRTTIDTRSGRMWAAAETRGGPDPAECGDSRSVFLWSIQVAQRSAACQAAIDVALSSTAGLGGWNIPEAGDVEALLAGWSGDSAGEWLAGAAVGMPSLEGLHEIAPPAPPDPGVLPAGVGDVSSYVTFEGNPGTSWGVFTSNCSDGVVWQSGLDTRLAGGGSSPVFTQATFCSYVRLRDAQRVIACRYAAPGYVPCSMPVATRQWGRAKPSGPLDYGHPNALFLWREVAAGERWFVR